MHPYRSTARVVGGLFLIAMIGSLLGGVGFVEPYLSAPDFLTAVVENENQVIAGVLLELINGLAVLGIGVLMFPVLRFHHELTALGYLSLRIIEAVFCCVIVIGPLSLIAVGQESLNAGAAEVAYLQAAGAFSIAARASVSGLLIPVFLGLGALLLYYALYQSKFVPRFISVWGLIGAVLILLMNLLLTFGVALGNYAMVFALPIITNEIFLGIWLIVKGFNPSAFGAEPARATVDAG